MLALTACDSGGDDAVDPGQPDAGERRAIECELGHGDGERGFRPLAEPGEYEMLLGFQGFLVILPRLKVSEDVGMADAKFSVAIDGDPTFGGIQPGTVLFRIDPSDPNDAGAVTEDIVVFLSPIDVGHFKDRIATLTIKFENDDATCTVQREVRLVDHDVCVHANDEPVCPDDEDTP